MQEKFNYELHSGNPVRLTEVPQVNLKILKTNINENIVFIDPFIEYVESIEAQRGYKMSRQERRKLEKSFRKRR